MDLAEYKLFLKKLLIGDTSAVLSNLMEAIQQNSNSYDEVIILQASFNMFRRKKMTGQLTNEEERITSAQLTSGILSFINSLQQRDLIETKWINKEKIKPGEIVNIPTRNSSIEEKFQEKIYWDKLEKIGRWSLNQADSKIYGQGVYQFLLSSNYYGDKDFTIFTRLKFNNYQKFASNILDNANSGIVLGWVANENLKRYYNILLTGKKILLEGVGLHGGDDYRDFIHFDRGVEFSIEDGQVTDFTIQVSKSKIDVFIDDKIKYSVKKPNDLIGKVGIRPWRSKIECSFFEIKEQ